ncbi:MAG: hypothetical protein JO257_19220 [Deltaproteobacteria bacterium]|nr:hypothetical protein [Deltaproteobacteria bacterium]
MKLGLVIALGTVLLVGTVLTIVFTFVGRAVRRRTAEQMTALESEGIERDSGMVSGTVRYRDFRAPGLYEGAGISVTRRRLVLTASHLAILGGKVRFHIPRPDLNRYEVGILEGRLQLVSDNPHGATGHIDLRIAVDDPETWASVLRAAGCQTVRSGT